MPSSFWSLKFRKKKNFSESNDQLLSLSGVGRCCCGLPIELELEKLKGINDCKF